MSNPIAGLRSAMVLLVLTLVSTACLRAGVGPPGSLIASPSGDTLHVRAGALPGGGGSPGAPFPSLQAAVEAAQPGDTILVSAGVYPGSTETVRSGTSDRPIMVRGVPGALLAGDDTGPVITVRHSHIVIEGLVITDANKLILLEGASSVVIRQNHLRTADGECVRIRQGSRHNIVERNRIEGCGRLDFRLLQNNKNGEGVYIGSAPETLPAGSLDLSSDNTVVGNVIDSPAECVDVKEGSDNNRVMDNLCTGNLDRAGAAISVRSGDNVIEANQLTRNRSAGIRLGGDGPADGVNNTVRYNWVNHNEGYGVKVVRVPQLAVCGNDVRHNRLGAATLGVEPAMPC